MSIWVNCVVHNEENFIWFAIMSVIDYVDKILVWDTGSTDNTVNVIKKIIQEKGKKIEFKEFGIVDKHKFPKVRQAMLEQSNCDWLFILDGDEIWWDESIKKVIEKLTNSGGNINGIVVPMVVPVGDIFHIQDESAGKYKLLGKEGHLNLRFINRKIPGLHVDLPYGKEGYYDIHNKLIQEGEKVIFLDNPYLHATHLPRSSKKRKYNKIKYELGTPVFKDFKYPEVFYKPYPDIISTPWKKISGFDYTVYKILTPLRRLKRKIISG